MKKIKLYVIAILLFAINSTVIHAADDSSIYSCDKYSVNIPDGFEVDEETLQDFTSFYSNDVTIGVRVTDNTTGENVVTLTEDEIYEITNETLSSVTAQAGEGITAKEHALLTFSSREYPALYIAYEGSSKLDDSVYMEEYIITTVSYKYTIVFSANNKEQLESEAVSSFKNNFTTTEAPLKKVDTVSSDRLMPILALCIATVVVMLCVTIFVIHQKSDKQPNKKHRGKKHSHKRHSDKKYYKE